MSRDLAKRLRKVAGKIEKLAVKTPSEQDGKSSYDDDFRAGFDAGKKALKKNDRVDISTGKKEYRRVSKKFGSWWVQGYGAALDLARGAHNSEEAQIAKKLKLASIEVTAAGNPWNSLHSFITKQYKEYTQECEKLLDATGKDFAKKAEKHGTLTVKDQAFRRKFAEISGREHEWTTFEYEVETDLSDDLLESVGEDVTGAKMRGLVSVEDSGFSDGTKIVTMRLWHPAYKG